MLRNISLSLCQVGLKLKWRCDCHKCGTGGREGERERERERERSYIQINHMQSIHPGLLVVNCFA